MKDNKISAERQYLSRTYSFKCTTKGKYNCLSSQTFLKHFFTVRMLWLTRRRNLNMNRVSARNYKFYRNRHFWEETKVHKTVAGAKSMPISYKKKILWFFSHVCNCKFAVFWELCCGITCKRVLLPYAL